MTDDWSQILDAAHVAEAARRELRADLRAQVQALPGHWVEERLGNVTCLVRYIPEAQVLTLMRSHP